MNATELLEIARRHQQDGQTEDAEAAYLKILRDGRATDEACLGLASLALGRGDRITAENYLQVAHRQSPGNAEVAQRLATLLAVEQRTAEATRVLETLLAIAQDNPVAWLLLAELRQRNADDRGALQASFQAVTRAQSSGLWLDQSSTPASVLPAVLAAVARLRAGRKDLLFDSYDHVRQKFGSKEVARVDRALRGYLKQETIDPPHSRQRPLFLYFPDLPQAAYFDPFLQPWAPRLVQAFPDIQREAVALLQAEVDMPDFLRLPPGSQMDRYLGGAAVSPAWKAFFFYRRGKKYEENHRRCPKTSEALESLDLCRIADQAPEICFSVIHPQTHLKAHHGVTNVRLVMHLPLLVPPGCALNLVDFGEHYWREGELVMFDDTYLHEAWNRSDRSRVVLLMDCWNPYLSEAERQAIDALIRTISALHPESRQTP